MESRDLARALIEALEERGVPAGLTLADLMMLEHHLSDSLRIVRTMIDIVTRSGGSGL